jgi:hypothetical protein
MLARISHRYQPPPLHLCVHDNPGHYSNQIPRELMGHELRVVVMRWMDSEPGATPSGLDSGLFDFPHYDPEGTVGRQ